MKRVKAEANLPCEISCIQTMASCFISAAIFEVTLSKRREESRCEGSQKLCDMYFFWSAIAEDMTLYVTIRTGGPALSKNSLSWLPENFREDTSSLSFNLIFLEVLELLSLGNLDSNPLQKVEKQEFRNRTLLHNICRLRKRSRNSPAFIANSHITMHVVWNSRMHTQKRIRCTE